MSAQWLIILVVITAIANTMPGANPAIGSNQIAFMHEQSNTALDIGVKTDPAVNNDKGERR